VRGDDPNALTPQQKHGLKIFIGKGACNDCHNGPTLTDMKFHNIGVPTAAGATQDVGKFGDVVTNGAGQMVFAAFTNVYSGAGAYSDNQAMGMAKLQTLPSTSDQTAMDALKGAFRTPSLLNVEMTFPYFHNGSVYGLDQVIDHYNRGGGDPGTFAGNKDAKLKPLMLEDDEKADLVAFLKSLTGTPGDPDWTKDIRAQ
jgi:cytochrome c peroxidase